MARSAAFDPIEKFRFTVEFISGERVSRAGFMTCDVPSESRGVINYREGNYSDTSEKSAGLTTYPAITLTRGVTADQDFYIWAEAHKKHRAAVRGNEGTAYTANDKRPEDEASNSYRRDIQITLLDRESKPVKRWKVYNAFVTEFKPGDNLDANAEEKLMTSLVVEHEGYKEEPLA
jgi:phage tail-like protein